MSGSSKKRSGDHLDDVSKTRSKRRSAPGKRKEQKKKQEEGHRHYFRPDLFDDQVLKDAKVNYQNAKPFEYGIISQLIEPNLLKAVRQEILDNLSFTAKETDIYKIHQSGDLANLDGLDDDSLKLLPSLLTLRNALYSDDFRNYIASIAKSGPLSAQKTDMAINLYTPGCHLLCHDDVIGSRRVSYILYLLDPEQPWSSCYGGALRLYSTKEYKCSDGRNVEIPNPDWIREIVPAFNQLCFFGVQPGRTFHDVEEVYSSDDKSLDQKKVRMAISGWYHLPQEGEPGFVRGLAEKTAANSSLGQLQNGDEHELPQPNPQPYLHQETQNGGDHNPVPQKGGIGTTSQQAIGMGDADDDILTESELEFLLKYINPNYLTPDNVAELQETFNENSSLVINDFLNDKYAASLRSYIESQPRSLPKKTASVEKESYWTVARPPHKHRYLFMLPNALETSQHNQNLLTTIKKDVPPLKEVLSVLLPSLAFRKWLHLATDLEINSYDFRARRFRRGYDYTLATTYEKEEPRLEMTLGITNSKGWEDDEEEETARSNGESDRRVAGKGEANRGNSEEEEDETEHQHAGGDDATTQPNAKDQSNPNQDRRLAQLPKYIDNKEPDSVGGYEVYMSTESSDPAAKATDPAVYQAAADEEEDDSILFSMPACWNRLSLVLRDKGVMKFVKYVSTSAKGDRWDVVGEFGVVDEASEEVEVGEGEGEEWEGIREGEEDEESTTDLAEGAEAELDSESD
ncbi:hypothetical protein MMC13_002938 [Lambiella insularis]|nr:hypothetical protein [Lambiella insularis]